MIITLSVSREMRKLTLYNEIRWRGERYAFYELRRRARCRLRARFALFIRERFVVPNEYSSGDVPIVPSDSYRLLCDINPRVLLLNSGRICQKINICRSYNARLEATLINFRCFSKRARFLIGYRVCFL